MKKVLFGAFLVSLVSCASIPTGTFSVQSTASDFAGVELTVTDIDWVVTSDRPAPFKPVSDRSAPSGVKLVVKNNSDRPVTVLWDSSSIDGYDITLGDDRVGSINGRSPNQTIPAQFSINREIFPRAKWKLEQSWIDGGFSHSFGPLDSNTIQVVVCYLAGDKRQFASATIEATPGPIKRM